MLASRHRDPASANPLSSLPHLLRALLQVSIALQRQIKTNNKIEEYVPVL